MQCRQFMGNIVGCPILRDSRPNQAVESHRGAPHYVGTNLIVIRMLNCFGTFLNQGLQNGFSHPVLERGIGRIGQILLQSMDKSIYYSIAKLSLRE